MPELPEVESIRRQLQPLLAGRRVLSYWVDAHPHARFTNVHLIAGQRIVGVNRRGKYLICPLDDTAASLSNELVLHLGMTGTLRLRSGEGAALAAEFAHVRASFRLDDGNELIFNDPRRFGRISVVPAGQYLGVIPTLANLGPEPLTDAFTPVGFATAVGASKAPIKAQLLDQHVVAGIGNIYADEALWWSGIHPASRRVGRSRSTRLHASIRRVLEAAVEREGTSFRDYRMVNGASGRNADYLVVYGKSGQPCPRCGAVLRKSVVAGRGTTYCPACQRI